MLRLDLKSVDTYILQSMKDGILSAMRHSTLSLLYISL